MFIYLTAFRIHTSKVRSYLIKLGSVFSTFPAIQGELFQDVYFREIKTVIFYLGDIKENLKQVGALYQWAAPATPNFPTIFFITSGKRLAGS